MIGIHRTALASWRDTRLRNAPATAIPAMGSLRICYERKNDRAIGRNCDIAYKWLRERAHRRRMTMPRFFFHFRQGGELIRDPEGTEFASVEEAFLDAARAAQDMWSELLRERRDPRRCAFEVRDADGHLLFLFPFQEVLEACVDRKAASIHATLRQTILRVEQARRAGDAFRKELSRTHAALKESRELLAVDI